MKSIIIVFIIIPVCMLLSCNPSSNAQEPTLLSLEVSILDATGNAVDTFSKNDSVSFLLTIENITDDSVTVTYMTSQKYDFYLYKNDKMVWFWANEKTFFVKTVHNTLAPGKIITFTENWPDEQVNTVTTGNYTLVGEHTGEYTGPKTTSFKFEIIGHVK